MKEEKARVEEKARKKQQEKSKGAKSKKKARLTAEFFPVEVTLSLWIP